MFSKNRIFIFFILTFIFQSCIFIKYDSEEEIEISPEIDISPKPIMELSNTMIRSSRGDMIALLPKDWFLVNLEDQISNEVIAVAVNKEYNLSAVFSNLKNRDEFEAKIKKEGLFGLAWYSYTKKEKKSAGNVKQVGKYQSIAMGTKKFVKYEYSASPGSATSKSVVFISTLGEYYEMTLIPMNVNANPQPQQQIINDTFQSILAGIKY